MPSDLILKRLDINDRDILMPYLISNPYDICDFSFSNIFMWRNSHPVDYAIHKGFLVLLSSTFDGKRHFFMPLGLGKGNLQEIINDMIFWSFANNRDFSMIGLTDKMIKELAFLGPDFIVADAMVWDYIYNTDDLIHLKGRKFHAKRNHINKFNSRYDYEYRALETAHIPLCTELLNNWNVGDNHNKWLAADCFAIGEALQNFDNLKMSGGCLFVDGRLGAFTMGQPVNDEVFAVHVEKGLTCYEGIYSKINQMFAERVCVGFKYINREEDMGIEGLRKSKMSYNPAFLMYKRQGVIKCLSN